MELDSRELVGLVVVLLLIGMGAGLTIAEDEKTVRLPAISESVDGTISEAETGLVAVDREGDGISTDLSIRTVPGNGRILVDIESLVFFLDTQQSIQTARQAAEGFLGRNVSDRDLVYDIEIQNVSIVGGESAGASLAVSTVSALTGKSLRNDTVMTGTINSDGSIGEVGGVRAKAEAAAQTGYDYFLVPEGQGTYTKVDRVRECEMVGGDEVCTTTFRRTEVSIGEDLDVTVKEVGTLEDAVSHYIPGY